MEIHVQKWGNSLALRIPKPFAEEIHVRKGSLMELCVQDGKIVLVPISKHRYTLKGLLSGVTKQNIHHEIDFGNATGREIW